MTAPYIPKAKRKKPSAEQVTADKHRRAIAEYGLGDVSASKSTLPISKRFTLAEIYALVEKTSGNTRAICTALDSTRQQWQAFLDKHPDVAALCTQAREAIVDKAEEVTAKLLDSSNEAIQQKTAEFILTTLGRSRGYDKSNAQQITVSKDGQVDIKQIFGL